MSNSLLKLIDISKYYSSQDAVTLGLRKVNVEFRKGEFVAVTGESGSGKSTLLNVLSGIDSYEEGEMLLDGQETSPFTNSEWDDYRRKNIAFIFQDYSLIDSYTALQNVELSLYDNYPDKKARRARALELLDKVGLLSHKRHKCTKLSGGQKQRVAIARALAKDAPIILADEPTGNLDSATSESIIKLIAETSKDKLLIMVTHNYDDVAEFATRKIRMYDGSIAEDKVVVSPPENIGGSELKNISEDEKKRFKGSVNIAVNNLLATPKRSLFILSTSFIATFLIAMFLFSYINVIVPPAGMNLMGDRRDTLYVIEKDRKEFTTEKTDTINAIPGVEGVLTSYEAYNMQFVPKTMIWEDVRYVNSLRMNILTTANYGNKVPAHGSVPTKDNEILLGWSNQGTPNLDLIGQEVELVLLNKYDYYYEEMFENSYDSYYKRLYYKKYIVTGFDVGQFCYITANEIEILSRDYIENQKPEIQVRMTGYKDINNIVNDVENYFYSQNTAVKEDNLMPTNIIYYVYNPNEFIIWENSETSMIAMLFENGNPFKVTELYINLMFYDQRNYEMKEISFTVLPATPSVNSGIYNNYIGDDFEPLFVINKTVNPYSVSSSKTTALVIISQDKKADNIIASITAAGYKVIYPFSRPLTLPEVVLRLVNQFFGFILGIVIVTIAVALISEVYSKVSKSKKRDFNILRTVGLSTGIIKTINYAEFIIINVLAFSCTFITFVILVIGGKVLGNASLTNTVNSLLPYGALHIQSLLVYAGVFALLMMLTLLIAKKFNKKMFSTSVKKSLTETA